MSYRPGALQIHRGLFPTESLFVVQNSPVYHLILEMCHWIKAPINSYAYMYKNLLHARQYAKPVAEIQPLYTDTEWNLGDSFG